MKLTKEKFTFMIWRYVEFYDELGDLFNALHTSDIVCSDWLDITFDFFLEMCEVDDDKFDVIYNYVLSGDRTYAQDPTELWEYISKEEFISGHVE